MDHGAAATDTAFHGTMYELETPTGSDKTQELSFYEC